MKELAIELCDNGIWEATVREELPCECEPRMQRTCCSYAVAASTSEFLMVIVMVNSHW